MEMKEPLKTERLVSSRASSRENKFLQIKHTQALRKIGQVLAISA